MAEQTSANILSEFREVRERQSRGRRALRMLSRNGLGIVGAIILSLVTIMAIAAPLIAPHDPSRGSIGERLRCPVFTSCPVYGTDQTITGSTENVLGTDQLGRDILSRIIFGARVSLIVGISAVVLGAVIGSVLGLLSGFYGGIIDSLIMRIGDIFLAFPFLLLAIAMVAVIGGGLVNVILVLALASWIQYARLMRGTVLSNKAQDYVLAARAIGAHDASLLFKHILPNVVTPIIVFGTFAVAAAIIAEASLSFLGLGVAGSQPTWGFMLADGRDYVATAWWLATIPGLAIMMTVLSINLLGDWLRDVLDPHLRNIE